MRIYLLDDDKNITNILKIIINQRQLGEVCGIANHPCEALEDIKIIKPDIVLTDLLMPEIDGISFVKKAKAYSPHSAFIMLSQVASKDMIASAYEQGVEFYIQKPLNSIEVEKILQTVTQHLTMKNTLQQMQTIFQNHMSTPKPSRKPVNKDYLQKLQKILQKLGIIGDVGSKDIITLISHLIETQTTLDNITIAELCKQFSPSPKSMEQRIRRTAASGMVNLANLGIEDYGNEIFTEYANSLYNFEQVRKEMDYIRGKSDKHGNIKIKNFLHALLIACTQS